MARKPNMAKLMEKIAAQLAVDSDELKEQADATKDLYSYEESVYQRQAIINFFENYVAPEEPRPRQGESKVAFAKRKSDYEKKRSEWRIRECKGCGNRFAYAYTYDGVRHCSLECLDATLHKIGISLTIGRDLKKRWGQYHPAVVPADALETLERLYGPLTSSSDVLVE